MSNVWKEMDAAAQPFVEKQLGRLGWKLIASGNHQWEAEKKDREETRIQSMHPGRLVELVEAHEKRLEQQRLRRSIFAESDDE